MRRTMRFAIELLKGIPGHTCAKMKDWMDLRIGEFEVILHRGCVFDALEVKVPAADIWHHVETHKPAHISLFSSHTEAAFDVTCRSAESGRVRSVWEGILGDSNCCLCFADPTRNRQGSVCKTSTNRNLA